MAERCRKRPSFEDLLPAFLADTLAMWRVEGRVAPGTENVVAAIHLSDGRTLSIERPQTTMPFRWLVRTRDAVEVLKSVRERAPRPCASLVGLLSTLRSAFGLPRGAALRVAAAAPRGPVGRNRPASPSERPSLAPERTASRIPVTVLTGFLGSGKTTLLGRLLRHPDMARTAVIINEFGEIALDHELIESTEESLVTLTNGCLCCKVRSDLALTLGDLAVRRETGAVTRFERVVIETSGLADPAPILHALMLDPALSESYTLDSVIATVDALTGLSTLERYPESLKQVALADRIAITKTDVPGVDTARVAARLAEVNARARVLPIAHGAISPSTLFANGSGVSTEAHPVSRSARAEYVPEAEPHHHSGGITSFAIVRSEPLQAATLALFLESLAESCGTDLLRMKGLVRVAEMADRPAVIHGVQHVYHEPEWLDSWPSNDRRTRMVFIARNVHERWVRAMLALLELEVKDVLRARSPTAA